MAWLAAPASRGHPVSGISPGPTTEPGGRTLFVTGHLAAPALRVVAEELDLPGGHLVAEMRITVAALMTTSWVAKRLEVPADVRRVVIAGLVQGDLAPLRQLAGDGVEVLRGPVDVQELPAWYGRARVRAEMGPKDVRVFAEINGVPHLSAEQVLDRADRYRADGADVVDLGLSLDRSWLQEGPAVIAALRERGHVLSVDTLDPEHVRMADAAGVDYVLSLRGETVALAEELRCTPVLIPEDPDDLDGLDRDVARVAALREKAAAAGRIDPATDGRPPFYVDPILPPLMSGFAAGLGRYLEVRRRHPDVEILMGIGNVTELTEADTTGVGAVLLGFAQEVGIRAVLTTEVVGWARGVVRETVRAAQIMHVAQRGARPPKHLDDGLVTLNDERVRTPPEAELRAMQERVTDPNVRLFADEDALYAFTGERFVKGEDLYEVFDALEIDDPTHAFYLGKELMKATIARGLGKQYRQEGPLHWGVHGFPEPQRAEGRPRRRRGHVRGGGGDEAGATLAAGVASEAGATSGTAPEDPSGAGGTSAAPGPAPGPDAPDAAAVAPEASPGPPGPPADGGGDSGRPATGTRPAVDGAPVPDPAPGDRPDPAPPKEQTP